jgi:hypothetical protein
LFEINYPPHFTDDEAIIATKGYVEGVMVADGLGNTFRIDFFDSARLAQDAETEFGLGRRAFVPANVVMVPEVTRQAIERAVIELSGREFAGLVPKDSD